MAKEKDKFLEEMMTACEIMGEHKFELIDKYFILRSRAVSKEKIEKFIEEHRPKGDPNDQWNVGFMSGVNNILNELDKLKKVLELFEELPLFGHTTGSQSKTHWISYMKIMGPQKNSEKNTL